MLTFRDIFEALTKFSSLRFEQRETVVPLSEGGTRRNGGFELPPLFSNWIIPETVVDSRLATPRSMFVALKGENQDGHDFVGDAFKHGSCLALVDKDLPDQFTVLDLCPPIDYPLLLTRLESWIGYHCIQPNLQGLYTEESFGTTTPLCLKVPDSLAALQHIAAFWRSKLAALRVIGVTGSVGKSSTKELIAQVLGQRYRTLKTPGNLNNEIGLPLTLLQLDETYERAVLEMGFYYLGEIALLCQLAHPHVGVITNIGTVHAERAGSQEAIARGKAELVEALPAAPQGVAILNQDDPWVRAMADKTQAQIFFYGTTPNADLWVDQVESLGLEGIRFRMHYHNEVLHLTVPIIGRHSALTALRATAVGLVENLSWQEIMDGLCKNQGQLRLTTMRTPEGALVLDDTYNASPESTMAALDLLADLNGHKIAVLGDMRELGPYERQGHEMVGERVAEIADELITVGPLGKIIGTTAHQSGLPSQQITIAQDSSQAIAYLKPRLKENDVILVKGSRAMQMDVIISGLLETDSRTIVPQTITGREAG